MIKTIQNKDLTIRFSPMKSENFKVDISNKHTDDIIKKLKSSKKKHKRDRSYSKKRKHKKRKHKSKGKGKDKDRERNNDHGIEKFTRLKKRLSITPEVTEDEPKYDSKNIKPKK